MEISRKNFKSVEFASFESGKISPRAYDIYLDSTICFYENSGKMYATHIQGSSDLCEVDDVDDYLFAFIDILNFTNFIERKEEGVVDVIVLENGVELYPNEWNGEIYSTDEGDFKPVVKWDFEADQGTIIGFEEV